MESTLTGDTNALLLSPGGAAGGGGAAPGTSGHHFYNRSAMEGLLHEGTSNVTALLDFYNYSVNTTLRPSSPYPRGPAPWLVRGEVRIPLYSLIFLLSVVGNTLVIVTLAQNKRMRTVTNVFLLNLSISDMLLAVFCMPFTLIPTLLQDFIFGKTMCIMIRYLQGKPLLNQPLFYGRHTTVINVAGDKN